MNQHCGVQRRDRCNSNAIAVSLTGGESKSVTSRSPMFGAAPSCSERTRAGARTPPAVSTWEGNAAGGAVKIVKVRALEVTRFALSPNCPSARGHAASVTSAETLACNAISIRGSSSRRNRLNISTASSRSPWAVKPGYALVGLSPW